MPRSTLVASFLCCIALALAATAGAQVHPPENVILLSHLDRGEAYSGNWGYTSPGGVELAISGTASGTSFINATDPANAHEVAFIPAPNSTWREMATYGEYCYIVTEASGAALQVVSLVDPLNPTLVATLNPPDFFYATAHEIKADPATGLLYVCGTSPGTGQPQRGLVILDLNGDPINPTLRGTWTQNYVHDISIKDGRAYAASVYDGIVYVLDVTNPGTPPVLAQWTYPGAFTHNTWFTDDNAYIVTTDENTGGHLRMWDVQNLSQITQTGEFAPSTGSIVHNAYIRGNICYISHYKDGLRVVDISDPSNLQPVGWYDTHPEDGSGFSGAWGCWCFAQDPSIAYITDIQTGTYILKFSNESGSLSGTVADASTQLPIEGALVDVEGANTSRTTSAQGTYSMQLVAGSYTVHVTAFGYEPASAPVTIAAGQQSVLDFDLVPLPSGSLAGVVASEGGEAPIAGATLAIARTPLDTTSNASGVYIFPTVPEGSYDVTASKFGFGAETLPAIIVEGQQTDLSFDLAAAFFAADMETSPGAWTTGGNATTGHWERVDPNGTGGGLVQPEDDRTPDPGVTCWITGQSAPGAGIGDNDVDNGSVILTTQVFDLSPLSDPVLDYWRWFVNDGNGQTDDPWVVEVSSNGGASWVAIENTLAAEPFWREITVRLLDVLTAPLNQFQVRFTARDLSPGSIVEAGVDDFQIYEGGVIIGIGDAARATGAETLLHGNSPNPFNPSTAIRFELRRAAPVRLRIFDASGRPVRELVNGRLTAGAQSVTWDGRNDASRPVASGVYYYQLEAPDFAESRSMVLLK